MHNHNFIRAHRKFDDKLNKHASKLVSQNKIKRLFFHTKKFKWLRNLAMIMERKRTKKK